MASRGLTLNAAIKLTATQFNAGIKQVQRSLNSLKSTFLQVAGALGAGLGLGTLVNEIKQTATQLSIAKATLENVADNGTNYAKTIGAGVKDIDKATTEYAENMDFLKKISNEYGQDLLGITQAFAKFRAAAGYAGVSLEEIRRIYKALTKAAGAYHLDAEQTANAMLAVEQMFSKGKVTSEELRRQLGNALPGAFGLMAKAAGMTTGEFEKAMKAGKILAADVLPKFADELNKITQGANFNSLQSSLNKFSNAWTNFSEKSGFEKFFKGLVDTGTKALNAISNNISGIKTAILSIGAGVVGGKIFSSLEKEGAKALKGITKEISVLENRNVQLQSRVNKLAGEYTKLQQAAQTPAGQQNDFYVKGLTAAEAKAAGLNQGLVNIIATNEKAGKNLEGYWLKAGNAAQVTAHRANELRTEIQKNELEIAKFGAVAQKQTSAVGRAFVGLKTVLKGFRVALKTALSSIGIGLLISLLTTVGQKLVEVITFSHRLKKETADMEKDVNTISEDINSQIAEVNTLAKKVADTTKSESDREKYLKRINEIMGLTGDNALTLKSTSDDINTAIKKWSDNIVKAAKRMALLQKIGELTTKNLELESKIDEAEGSKKWYNTGIKNGEIERYRKEMERNNKLIEKFREEAEKLTGEIDFGGLDGNDSGGGGGGNKETDLQKAIDKYVKSLNELENQEKNGAISKQEFQEAAGELAENTWKEIAAYDNLEEQLKQLGGKYVELGEIIKEAGSNFSFYKATKKDMEEAYREAERKAKEYENAVKRFRDIVTDPLPQLKQRDTFFDYKKTDKDIIGEDADNMEEFQKKVEGLVNKLQELKRDVGENWDTHMQSYLDLLLKKLKEITDQAKTLREQASIAELTEDIKRMKKEIRTMSFENFKDVAGGMHNLAESVMSLDEAMHELEGTNNKIYNEEERKKYKAMIAIVDELTQMYNTFMSIIKTITEFNEKKEKLDKAIAAQEALTSTQRIAAKQTEMAIEGQSMTTTVSAEGAKQAAMTATMAVETASVPATIGAETAKQTEIAGTTTALGGQAVAGAAASQASIPYIGPILAAAAVAGIVGLLMMNMKKFATGGYVGGSSYSGDNQLVRVNSGELILNPAQQRNLLNVINGRNTGGVGKVEFVLRGDKLLGAINNYQSRSRGSF